MQTRAPHRRRWLLALCVGLLGLAPALAEAQQSWTNMATVSPTTTLSAGHVCATDGRDIYCDSSTPLLTGLGSLDRIVSGTAGVYVSSSGVINFSTGGVTTGYFNSSGLLVAPGISLTTAHGISSTNGFFSGNVGISTTAPVGKLHIMGANGNQLMLDNGGQQWTQVNFQHNGSSTSSTFIALDGTNRIFVIGAQGGYSTFQGIGFRPNGASDAMTILRNGLIGISTTQPSTSLHVSGTLRIADGGEACDANRAGAIRYTSSSIFQTCNGGGTWQAIGTGSGGASRLASLTDVSLSNVTGLDILRYNGTSWTNVNVQDTISTTTMVAGWPDAIECGYSNGTQRWRYFHFQTDTSGAHYYVYSYGSTVYMLSFNSDGTFNTRSHAGAGQQDSSGGLNCTLSISGYYAAGRAFNFIGGQGQGNDRIVSSTTNMTVNSATSTISFTVGGVTTGYMNSSGLLVAPGISITAAHGISSTNAYVSGKMVVGPVSVVSSPVHFLVHATNPYMALNNSVAGKQSGILFYDNQAGSWANLMWHIGTNYNNGGDQNFFINNNSTGNLLLLPTTTASVAIGRVTPTTKLDVNGTLRIADGGEACDANRAGAIRYTSSSIFQTCNGGGTWQAIGTGSGGASRLASLTDVSLSLPVSAGQVLMSNGTSWTNSNISLTMAGYEVVGASIGSGSSGWFYANCPSGKKAFGGSCETSNGGIATNGALGTDRYGCYAHTTGYTWSAKVACAYASTDAGNIVDSDKIVSGSTRVVANGTTNTISFTVASTTTGYMDSAGRLVVPGISITQAYGVSSTIGYFSGKIAVGNTSGNAYNYLPIGQDRIDIGISGSPRIVLEDNGVVSVTWQVDNFNGNLRAILYNNGTISTPLTLASNTNVGIGFNPNFVPLPSTSLHVSGTLRIADGGEACDINRAGAIRYTSSSVFQTCNGGGTWQAIGTGSGGASRLASLTDVSLSNVTGLDILRFNGTSWTNVNVQNTISTTTMSAGWPDAIECLRSDAYGSNVFYLGNPTSGISNTAIYMEPSSNSIMRFSRVTGNYLECIGDLCPLLSTSDCTNTGQGIARLYSVGRAFNFIGGSGTTSSNGDRITSGTTSVIASSNTTYISLTTGGSVWGYLSSGTSYLPRIGTAHVSTSTVSGTALQLISPTAVFACNSSTAGTMRYNSPTTTLELCTGSGWQPMGVGIPAGTISAFASTTCPVGWSEYTAARGRFLRGIDNGAGNDISGTRAPGDLQADAFQGHQHSRGFVGNRVIDGSTQTHGYGSDVVNTTGYATDGANGIPRASSETRPKNVAVTFCQFNGTSNGWNNPLSGGSTTPGGSTGAVQYNTSGSFDGSANFTWNNGAGLLTVAGTISTTSITVAGRTLEQYIASSTTAGTTRLASLTDVSLSSPTAGNLLSYNGTSWTNISLQQTVSTTTMLSGWPDAIKCVDGSLTFYIILSASNASGPVYRQPVDGAGDRWIQYNWAGTSTSASSDGVFNLTDCVQGTSLNTINKLYAAGRAYNYIGGSGQDDRIVSGTSAVTVNSATSTISFTVANTTTGYMDSAGRLVVPGISATTNNSSFTSGYFSGNVGVGTATPSSSLHVATGGGLTLGVNGLTNSSQTIYSLANSSLTTPAFQILANGSGSYLKQGLRYNGSDNGWIQGSGALVLNPAGQYVGVGVLTPSTSLHVSGTLRIADGGEACDANRAGAIRYTSASTFQTCNGGGTWQAIGAGGGGASSIDDLTDGASRAASGTVYLGTNAGGTGTGTSNTVVGINAYASSTTGTANTVIGAGAMRSGTNNGNNVAVGYEAIGGAGGGYNNTAMGYQSLYSNNANSNVAVGTSALTQSIGSGNTGLGLNALAMVYSGDANTAVGAGAGKATFTNTVNRSTFVGYQAGTNLTNSVDNTFMGYQAGLNVTTGSSNTLLGILAGQTITTGGNNIIIGHNVSTPANSTNNYLNIGGTIYGDVASKTIGINTAPNASATLSVGGAVRVSGTTDGCGSNNAGSIRYNSGTFESCNGSSWSTLGGAGVSRLASLTDVGLSSVSAGQILWYNGTSWTNVNVQDTISTTTIMAGWPDAIKCSGASGITYMDLNHVNGTSTVVYRMRGSYPDSGGNIAYIAFNYSNGTFNTYDTTLFSGYMESCNGISIAQHYAAGTAYNFIGGSGTVTPSVDNINSGTTRVTVNSATSTVSITTAGTTTAYFTNVGRLVVPGISATTNNSSFTSGYFSGNVGVGTATPLNDLDVNGVIRASGALLSNPAGVEGGQIILGYAGATGLAGQSSQTWNVDVDSANRFRIFRVNGAGSALQALTISETSGYIGIGTADPSAPLSLGNSTLAQKLLLWESGTTRYGFGIQSNEMRAFVPATSTVGHTWGTVSSTDLSYLELMRLTRLGQLGIGIGTPSTSLHVDGTLRIANGGEACDANRAGAVRWNGTQFQVCYGSGGWALLSSAATSGTAGGVQDSIVSGTTNVTAYTAGRIDMTVGGTERARLTSAGVSTTGLYVAGDISYTGVLTDVSDRRLKDKIAKLPYGKMLERFMLLRPVQFEMKNRPGLTEYGFIAQELQKVFPDLVYTANDPQKTLSLNTTGLIAPMVQAMQELKRENDALKAKVETLEQRLQRLERLMDAGGRTVH